MGRDLPSGNMTFFFTDIESSTSLLDQIGAEPYADALVAHRRILRDCCASNGGVEVDNQGDAFFFVFIGAQDAVAAAAGAQAALSGGPVRVRMGLHTGTALVGAEGYVGLDVHRAARIAGAGSGGQVLISAATAALVGKDRLTDLGEHRLKDLAASIRLYQLGSEPFPRLKSLYNTNLPLAIGTFVGREDELAELVKWLSAADCRLVTLTGTGGTGKTRLAQQVAAEVADHFPDGVWWVPLAAVRDVSTVLPTIAQVLEIKAAPDEEPSEVLLNWLRGKRPLLVMDNVEQLLPGVAGELRRLLERSEVVILVTSRERLQLNGERRFPVSGLGEADGRKLFVGRATFLDPGFADDGAVAELCQLLDNLPLAIELAAARTLLFPPRVLLERVGERLDLFRAGRDADPRQQTLRTTIEWSYDLLDSDEARLFRELGVFVGGCSYGAAAAVAGADPDTLQSLIDKSLVRQRETELGPRYSMLETVRQYAAERLAGAGQEAVRDRHLQWVADKTFANWRSARNYDTQAMAFLRAEQPNIRLALTHAIESSAAEPAQHIVEGTWFYWATAGLVAEGDRWASAVIDIPSPPTLEQAQVLTLAGEFARYSGDWPRAVELKVRALKIFAVLDQSDPSVAWNTAATHTDLCESFCEMGELERARAHAMVATDIRRRIGDPFGIAHALAGVALVEEKAGRLVEAAEALTEVVATYERLGIEGESADILIGLANLHRRLGNFDGAAQMLATALARANVSGAHGTHAAATAALGLLAADQGRHEEAVEFLSRAMDESSAGGYVVWERPAVETALAESRARIAATAAPGRVANSEGP